VLWQLATELAVPLYEGRARPGVALQQAVEALWRQLSADSQRLHALVRAASAPSLQRPRVPGGLCRTSLPPRWLDTAEAAALLRYLLDWLG